jgi:hypothetical protein
MWLLTSLFSLMTRAGSMRDVYSKKQSSRGGGESYIVFTLMIRMNLIMIGARTRCDTALPGTVKARDGLCQSRGKEAIL